MNYYHMQLHPNSLSDYLTQDILEIIESGVIGIDIDQIFAKKLECNNKPFNDWTEKQLDEYEQKYNKWKAQIKSFLSLNNGDYVVIRHGNQFVALTEIIGNYIFEKANDLVWFRHKYPIKILTTFKVLKKIYTFQKAQGTFEISKSGSTYDTILEIVKEYENSNIDKYQQKINIPLNQILFGPPGTGKTYHTINKAVEIADNEFYNQNKKNRAELKRRFKELKENNQIVFTTFHQSMSYEEFLESLKPFEKDEKIYYKIEDGIFKQICEKASQTKRMSITIENKEVEFTKEILQDLYSGYVENLPDQKNEISEIILSTTEGAHFQLFKNSANSIVVKAGEKKANMSVSSNELINIYFENKIPAYKSYAHKIFEDILSGKNFKKIDNDNSKKNFVLIIDEINRGNIASIFGELITLIEDDKRKGEAEELSVKLPYSKQDFTVPKNLYIIGTMNTADRSVEALDSALRRRFVFNEMQPDETLLKKDFYGINLQEVLKWINLRIEKLIDKDHKIGHSYFMNLETEIDLQNAFKNKIIPLLEEYFYGDFAKIGLVLGADFISKNNFEENIFKKIEDFENYTDFENRIIYKTTVPESIDEFINAVKNIYL